MFGDVAAQHEGGLVDHLSDVKVVISCLGSSIVCPPPLPLVSRFAAAVLACAGAYQCTYAAVSILLLHCHCLWQTSGDAEAIDRDGNIWLLNEAKDAGVEHLIVVAVFNGPNMCNRVRIVR